MAHKAAPAAAVFVAALAVYLRTLHPDLAGGDSGELVAAVATGGVIHPPGYPLYALLGKLFLLVPHGSVAWRLNAMSAVCDAAAAALLFEATSAIARSRAAGVVSAATFAFSPLVWRYATCAEVFAPNNLAVAALVWIAVRYERDASPRDLLWGALVAGLGLSNHHTFVCTAIPLTLWALWTARRDLRAEPRRIVALVGAFALGLAPYLYLPIAAKNASPVSWGTPDTWSGFWTHVTRAEYGSFQLAPAGVAAQSSAGTTLGAWASDAVDQIGWWGVALAIVGLVSCVRALPRRKLVLSHALVLPPVLAVGVIVVLGNLPVTDLLHRDIVARFWQQPQIYLCIACGAGFAAIERRVPRAAALAIAMTVSIAPLAWRLPSMDRHQSTLVRSYGAEILRAAPPGALLFTRGDVITNSVRYLQSVEHVRTDVRVVDLELLGFAWERAHTLSMHPDIALPEGRYMPGAPDGYVAKHLLDANVPRGRVFVCGGLKAGDFTADASYGMWPHGFCGEARSGGEPVNVDAWIDESDRALPRIDFAGQPRPPGSWEDIVWSDYWEVRQQRGAHLLAVAGADPARRKYIAVAAEILQRVVDENPDAPAHVWRNLAMALGRSGLDTPDKKARALTAWKEYLRKAPRDDPQREAIEREVERLERSPAP